MRQRAKRRMPKNAIRRYCLDYCHPSKVEVKSCPAENCPHGVTGYQGSRNLLMVKKA